MLKGWIDVALKSVIAGTLFLTTPKAPAQERRMIVGADISMLPEIEKAGGVYRENDKPDDAIRILRNHGFTLFRVRLFVNPSTDFNKSYGATQDLPYVRALAKRIKSAGGDFLLDLHYSDTWADPAKQFKPVAWKDLDFDALQKQVHDYTASVLADLHENQADPDMVQIGNEITGGIVWPDGKVLDATKDQEAAQWKKFSQLLNAGAKAVREHQPPARIMIHIDGGGKPGRAKWFFGKLNQNPVDFDLVGLSFYPAWGDSFDALKQNMDDVIETCNKDVIIAETSYPWRTLNMRDNPAMRWPETVDGQKQFVGDLTGEIKSVSQHRGLGFIWWYPEAIPVAGLGIWRNGHEALFDEHGNILPTFVTQSDR
jgi:arabinogalactan endo-1,4-beta-galactosidase